MAFQSGTIATPGDNTFASTHATLKTNISSVLDAGNLTDSVWEFPSEIYQDLSAVPSYWSKLFFNASDYPEGSNIVGVLHAWINDSETVVYPCEWSLTMSGQGFLTLFYKTGDNKLMQDNVSTNFKGGDFTSTTIPRCRSRFLVTGETFTATVDTVQSGDITTVGHYDNLRSGASNAGRVWMRGQRATAIPNVFEITGWDMDADMSNTISHDLQLNKVIDATTLIVNDSGTVAYPITYHTSGDAAGVGGSTWVDVNNININRKANQVFDDPAFSGSGHRGYVVVWTEEKLATIRTIEAGREMEARQLNRINNNLELANDGYGSFSIISVELGAMNLKVDRSGTVLHTQDFSKVRAMGTVLREDVVDRSFFTRTYITAHHRMSGSSVCVYAAGAGNNWTSTSVNRGFAWLLVEK